MLQKSTIEFLKNLKENNNKEWFDANRKIYEAVKADFLGLVAQNLKDIEKLDARFAEVDPKKCIFRINRDVRFSKDKSPYKTNMGAGYSPGGKNSPFAAYYFHLEPGNSFIGGGLWMPEAEQLKKVRQEIDYNYKDFKKIVENKKFVATYTGLSSEDMLKNPPKGYEIENPAIEYLKRKSFVSSHPIKDSDLTDKNLSKIIKESFTTLQPLISFINTAIAD